MFWNFHLCIYFILEALTLEIIETEGRGQTESVSDYLGRSVLSCHGGSCDSLSSFAEIPRPPPLSYCCDNNCIIQTAAEIFENKTLVCVWRLLSTVCIYLYEGLHYPDPLEDSTLYLPWEVWSHKTQSGVTTLLEIITHWSVIKMQNQYLAISLITPDRDDNRIDNGLVAIQYGPH